jgi:hypothetical protein
MQGDTNTTAANSWQHAGDSILQAFEFKEVFA